MIPVTVPLAVNEPKPIPLVVSDNLVSVPMGLATAVQVVTGEHYHGDSEVTPCDHDVVLHTEGLFVDEPITIKAIPNNYGLITWDGIALTVS